MIPGRLLLLPFVLLLLLLLLPILLLGFLQDFVAVTDVDMGLEALHDLLPVNSELKLRLLLELSETTEHGAVTLLQFLGINLEDLLDGCWLSCTLQCSPQHINLLVQLLHLVPGLGEVVETQTAQEVSSHDTHPLVHCLHQIPPHVIYAFQCPSAEGVEVETRRVVLGHQGGDMFQFGIHFGTHLLDAADLRDDVRLTMQLQVLSDTLRAEQLDTFETEVPQDLIGVVVAVASSEGGSRFSDGTGCGEEGSGVGMVGRGCVQARIFLIQKVHLQQLMGGAESSYQQRFHQRYAFVQPLHDPNYGPLKVYRKRELNFDYVALIERLLPNAQLAQTKHELELELPPMLLRVFQVESGQNGQCGAEKLRVWLEYLTFSLRDEIAQRRDAFQGFTLEEVAYVIHSAIDTYLHLQTLGCSHLALRPETVLITVEGFLRFSPLRVIDFQQESAEEDCECMPRPVVQNYFQKSQRQFLVELKNLLHEMVAICPRSHPHFASNYDLLTNVNHSRTIAHLRAFLPPSSLDALLIAKKAPESTELSTVRDPGLSLHYSTARSKRSLRESSAQWSGHGPQGPHGPQGLQ